jgi:hypothetical protein
MSQQIILSKPALNLVSSYIDFAEDMIQEGTRTDFEIELAKTNPEGFV